MNIIIELLKVLLFYLILWISMFLATFAHELGHVLMFKLFFGDKNWNITLGMGKTIFEFKKITIKALMIKGKFNFKTEHKGSRFKYIMVSLGGPLANIVFILVLIFLALIMENNQMLDELPIFVFSFTRSLFFMNVYMTVFNLIPMKLNFWPYKHFISDGYYIYSNLIRKKEKVT